MLSMQSAVRRIAWSWGAAAGLLAVCAGAPGCMRGSSGQPVTQGAYGDSADELRRLWSEVLHACQRDDRAQVRTLMGSFVMTQPELGQLLGEAQAQALWPRYRVMMGALSNVGAVELVAHVYEKKYDDIAVTRIDTLPAEQQTETDRNVAQALQQKTPFYTVRVKRHDEASGLRYDFFVYRGGYWRSGNLLGKYLPKSPAQSGDPVPQTAADRADVAQKH